jgi:hypothetical protein
LLAVRALRLGTPGTSIQQQKRNGRRSPADTKAEVRAQQSRMETVDMKAEGKELNTMVGTKVDMKVEEKELSTMAGMKVGVQGRPNTTATVDTKAEEKERVSMTAGAKAAGRTKQPANHTEVAVGSGSDVFARMDCQLAVMGNMAQEKKRSTAGFELALEPAAGSRSRR